MIASLTRDDDVYVLDTVALVRHLTGHKKLGSRAKEVFATAENGYALLIVSPIVIAELYYSDKKYNLFPDFREVYSKLRSQPQFRFVKMSADEVLDFDLMQTVPEMHDRIVACLAHDLGVPVVTNDSKIRNAESVKTIW